MIIRFKDFRTVKTYGTYGKEIYTTNNLEEARQYMKVHDKEMRFLDGGGVIQNGDYIEIYWDIVDR